MAQRTVSSHLMATMPQSRQASIRAKDTERSISISEHDANMVNTNVEDEDLCTADFLRTKEKIVAKEISYHNECLSGLADIDPEMSEDVSQERSQIIACIRPLLIEQKALTKCKRGLSQDMGDELVVSKKRKGAQIDDPEQELRQVTGAYARSMNMFSAQIAGNKKSAPFNQSTFKQNVLQYYEGGRTAEDGAKRTFCHVTGKWYKHGEVKAAHLVAKSYDNTSIGYLFGSDESETRSNPGNALLLLGKIEESLDKGLIAIVPIPSARGLPTRWKCILVDTRVRKLIIYSDDPGNVLLRFSDIENKELQFLNDARPARRFLYFRFVMTLIQAKSNGQRSIVQDLGLDSHSTAFWASPGEYLRRSTLKTLARNVSGLELPEPLVNSTTFDDVDQSESNEEHMCAHLTVDAMEAVEQQQQRVARSADDSDKSDEDAEEDD